MDAQGVLKTDPLDQAGVIGESAELELQAVVSLVYMPGTKAGSSARALNHRAISPAPPQPFLLPAFSYHLADGHLHLKSLAQAGQR